jgi:hypothetical protein
MNYLYWNENKISIFEINKFLEDHISAKVYFPDYIRNTESVILQLVVAYIREEKLETLLTNDKNPI